MRFTSRPQDSFRCLLHQRAENIFLAECVDLNLVVIAETQVNAVVELRYAIVRHIDAFGGKLKARIQKSAPFFSSLRYRIAHFQSRTKPYREPVPVLIPNSHRLT